MFNSQSILQNLGRLHDLCVACTAFYLAFGISSDFGALASVPGINDKALLYTVIAGFMNYFSTLNRGTWRYASIPDLLSIVKSAFLTAALFTILLFMLSRADNLPRSVPPLAFVFAVFGMSGSRLAYRIVKERGYLFRRYNYSVDRPKRNVLLVGVNDNAESFIRSVRRSETCEIKLIGLLDNRLEKSLRVQGLRVFGSANSLTSVTAKLAGRGILISELIITNPNLPTSDVSSLLTSANELGLTVSRIPNLSETSEIVSIKPIIKKLDLSDLLGRHEYRTESSESRQLIQNKTVLITGAGGSIGSEIARQIARFGSKLLILCDSSEYALYKIDTELQENNPTQPIHSHIVDVRDREAIFGLFEKYKPQVVFHAAALKHVPLMENNRLECLKTNVLGTRNVADAAVENLVDTFVLISTDKAVNPTNIMGASKRAAEVYCQAKDLTKTRTRFKTVRFGNVLGSTGSVVPRFQKQIDDGGPVTVTHPEITRFFMTIPEAVRLVLQASADGLQRAADRGLILVLDMGEPIRIDDLARKMIELSGLRPDIDILVEYTGLRPGEKLYEELFDLQESTGSANENGYFVAAPRIVPEKAIDRALRGIESAVKAADEKKAVESLKIIVAEYQVQHKDA